MQRETSPFCGEYLQIPGTALLRVRTLERLRISDRNPSGTPYFFTGPSGLYAPENLIVEHLERAVRDGWKYVLLRLLIDISNISEKEIPLNTIRAPLFLELSP